MAHIRSCLQPAGTGGDLSIRLRYHCCCIGRSRNWARLRRRGDQRFRRLP